MEPLFLLSDESKDNGHQLISSILRNGPQGVHVIVFMKNFDQLRKLHEEFAEVTWIVLDINRDQDTTASILRVLPVANYLVNFSGQNFADVSLQALKEAGNKFKERERGLSELTFSGIVDEDDGAECKIFINVVEKRSELKRKSKTFTKTVGKLVKGAKKTLENLTQDDDCLSDENEPLINVPRHQEDSESRGFWGDLIYSCCACFSKPVSEPEYHFRNSQELRLYIKGEHLAEVHRSLATLREKLLKKWTDIKEELHSKETQQLEDLVSRIDELRNEEEQELSSLKDKQNRNTKEKLSGVLSQDTIKRIEASRSRQTKGTVHYDADRAFREGQQLILNQLATEKSQLQELHYTQFVGEQLKKLSELNLKYKRKEQNLYLRYFGNTA